MATTAEWKAGYHAHTFDSMGEANDKDVERLNKPGLKRPKPLAHGRDSVHSGALIVGSVSKSPAPLRAYAVVETLPKAGPGGAIENSPAIYRRVFVR